MLINERGAIDRFNTTLLRGWKKPSFIPLKFALSEAIKLGFIVAKDNFEIVKSIQGGSEFPESEFELYE